MEKDYIILSHEKEYPGYTGTEEWMIVTDLSKEELVARYPEKSKIWEISVIITTEMAKVMDRYQFNEKKHRIRSLETEESIDEMDQDFEDPNGEDITVSLWVEEALDTLPEDQRRRVYQHFCEGHSISAISRQEHVNMYTVRKSINKGLRHLREYCGVIPVAGKVVPNA